ncbi:uncharacterized protein LOC129724041 [Wyeomyia smithii]|uniref:uncharacterized protein LOC129724041 n=1 Tax=Wyeomyia smithii TaxID=174621 RepID=UPI002467C7C1|nr:uncharacterized protein LOC129724041 [Wyeomyia smithii]
MTTQTDVNRKKARREEKRSYRNMLEEFVVFEDGFVKCRIDTRKECDYKQKQDRYVTGNYIRHMRTEHRALSKAAGLLLEDTNDEKKRKVVRRKIPVAIDRQSVAAAVVKLVTIHHLPLQAVQWEGMQILLKPICDALGTSLNRSVSQSYVSLVANAVRELITQEVKCRLISIRIDSASRQNRLVIGVHSQFAVNGEIVVRTLGIIEFKERPTAKLLKSEIIRILDIYEISLEQVFSVTYDNGEEQHAQSLNAQEAVDYDDITEEAAATLTLDGVMHELGNSIDLVRSPMSIMQSAIGDVVNQFDREIRDITLVAKNCRKLIYKSEFDSTTLPPFYGGKSSWDSIYLMLKHFSDHDNLFKKLGSRYGELDLSEHRKYIKDYVAAFRPLYNCVKNMNGKHVSLADFNLRWLHTIFELSKLETTNRFVENLTAALQTRLASLKNSMAFNCALFVDPRVHYYNSTLFDAGEKDKIKKYIFATWEKLSQFQSKAVDIPKTDQEIVQEEMDLMISKMFGDSRPGNNSEGVLMFQKQLNTLEVDTRQNASVDIWAHWMARKSSHPELHSLATIFLAVPSNPVALDRTFSALDLVVSDARSKLSDVTLNNILIVKLNREILDTALQLAEPSLLALDN